MSGQEAMLAARDAELTAGFIAADMGDTATYTAPGDAAVACSVLVNHGVQFFGDDPQQIVGVRTTLRFLEAEVGTPVRGGVVVVGSRTYKLDKEVDREAGVFSLWVVIL